MAITITLPDNTTRNFNVPVSGEEIAASIGKGLAKAALAIRVNGKLQDMYLPVSADATVEIVTPNSPEGLEIIRHDAAHLMAEAVKELFPDTQVTIGPAIENGFYYDFAREKPFSTEDLSVIEKRMQEISLRAEPVRREEWNRDKAVEYFHSIGEHYKAEIIASIPTDQTISLYKQGNFMDLCRGPHAPSTAHIKAFKLMKVAGAYWRGDSNNAMLQRIYGTAWADEKQLKAYLTMLEEAEKRDHRKLGRELDLFHIQEEAIGQIFWHDKGWTLFRTVENFIRQKLQPKGYKEVKTPLLLDRSLWEASGHWDKFGAKNMFTAESENHVLALKPMNCPGHIQIFKQGTKSYRDLPLRMAEFGSCHRNEPSGALHGIMRVRGFTQDDAHIFCTPEQITGETIAFCDLLKDVYKAFGFNDIKVKFSDRPPTRAGEDRVWDIAENALKDAVSEAKLDWTLNPGEGAFYGPKLEFVLRDAIGRDWQCGTLQVDFVLPERLDAEYVGPDGAKHRPVMLHRAILGSLERFIGILIEEYAGKFPFWLAPVQVMVTTITNEADDYALEVKAALETQGIRTGIDISSSKINYKIREHSNAKIPAILALGAREKAEKTVSIRRIGSDKQEVMSLIDAVQALSHEARTPI